jgi:hypothetical protein
VLQNQWAEHNFGSGRRYSRAVAAKFGLPYTYGDRLRFSGQYVLLVAVALGQATVVKEGRSCGITSTQTRADRLLEEEAREWFSPRSQ